jgi:dihydroorotase
VEAVQEVIDLQKKTGGRFHIAHASTVEEIELLKDSQISFEVAPHHIFCSSENYKQGGYLWKCNPPLRNPETASSLLRMLHSGKIQMIATDHAPHVYEDKIRTQPLPASGIPSLEVGSLLILNEMFAGKLSEKQVSKILSENTAQRFQIQNRGKIKKGYFADFAFVNPTLTWTFTRDHVMSKCGWSPFENTEFHTKVIATMVNGQLYKTDDITKDIAHNSIHKTYQI